MMGRRGKGAILCASALSLGLTPLAIAQEAEKDLIAKGQYVFALSGGCACHTAPKKTPHAGGRAFPIPFGKVFATNITPDKRTGIGTWSDQDIHDSMVKGVRPDGEWILPVMPYQAYSGMAQEDLRALVAYLKTLKPVQNETPALKSWMPFFRSIATPVWLKLFGRFHESPPKTPQSGVDRGRYLVEHVSICGDCHTPRNFIGVPNRSLYLAGAKEGPLDEEIPNITPDKETGIGDWSREDIAELLLTGIKPDLDSVQGLMDEVVQAGYKNMKREDALAIADYLKTIPPIKNKIE